YFTGYLFGFYFRGEVHRFTTYTGAGIRHLKVDEDLITLEVEDRKLRMEISGKREEGACLKTPRAGGMTGRINETLNSSISLRLSGKRGGETLYSGVGRRAGLEYAGDVRELISELAPP
ncbi:MAG: hypothetical protein KBI48_14595, partial [Deltaproteobacteria bacterium]|nr:hypothetical protein [Deltaproteobacteria bacterium]